MAHNQYYPHGGNPQYYYYPQTNQNYYQQDPLAGGNNDDEEDSLNFNPLEWLFTFMHYWYLFVIALAIALGMAMLKNRRWIPTYYSQGTIVIKESSPYGNSASSSLMQGFSVDAGYKNVNNQMIMLGSYDLMSRVVDSLPFLNVEYITQGRFKTRQLYRNTPIVIEYTRLHPRAYEMMFLITSNEDGTMHISSSDESMPLELDVHFGEPVSCPLFDIKVWPTEMLTSSTRVFFRFRTHESLVTEFMGRLQLSFVRDGSTVLALSLVSETPQRDCEFLDKLVDIYLLQNLEQKNKVAENSIRFINEQLENLQASLQVSEGAITDFRQENKFVDVNSYAGQLMGRISEYEQQAMELRLRETYFDYLIKYIHDNIEKDAVIAPTTMGVKEPVLVGLVQQLNDLRIKRGELTQKNVYYAKYTKDIENVKLALEEVVTSMRASLEIEKTDLNNRYKDVEKSIRQLPEKELQMVAIERNYRIDENYYTFFRQKRAEAEIQKASNTPDNSIMDRARTTAVMNANAKSKTTTIYLVIGLLIPFFLIIISELLNNKIRSPKDVVKLRKFRLLAALYGLTGKKTLLVDLDLRKPNIHTKLGLENGVGLSNYLVGECELNDAMVKDTPFGFDLLRAGTIPPNPGELIHSDKLTQMMSDLREQYDFVVIDTSPIGLVPDAYAVIEQCDLCLYVIRCMETNKSFCKQTLDQMKEVIDNPEKVQIVLSDIPTEGRHSYGSGYGYGYGGYGGYGYGHYGYGGYGGYAYGYGDGYRSERYGKLYGKLYGRLLQDEKAYQSYRYYHSEEDDEEIEK